MKTILIVEDEKLLLQALSQKLTREGFSIITALEGSEGYKIALQKHPDLILLDIIMPGIDGITMLSKVRNDPWGKQAPVIVLTNVDTASPIYDQIMKYDPMYYFIKSDIQIQKLCDIIKEVLT